MRLLDRLIIREILGPFFFGVALFTSIFFAGKDLLKIISDIVRGMPIGAAMELIFLQLPSVVVMILPVATLLATLLALTRLSSESELIALYAGGVSLYRAVYPVFALGIAVSIIAFALNEVVVPRANQRSSDIRVKILSESIAVVKSVPIADVKDGVTNSLVYVRGGIDPKSRMYKDVDITLYRNNAPQAFFVAKSMTWRGNVKKGDYSWLLKDVHTQSLNFGGASGGGTKGAESLSLGSHVDNMVITWLRHTPDEIDAYQRRSEEMTFAQLMGHIRLLHARGLPTVSEELDLYNKIAIPLSALVFAVLASSLGLKSHRGGSSVGLGLSILIVFAYWIMWNFSSALAKTGTLPPLLGSFSASLITLTVGFCLLVRAAR